MIDYFRTGVIPYAKQAERIMVYSLLSDVSTLPYYRKFESLMDGVIEFKREEAQGQIGDYVRGRTMRGKAIDTRWHRVKVDDAGNISFSSASEINFRRANSNILFECLKNAYVDDYTVKKLSAEASGWRSLVELAHLADLTPSALYAKTGGMGGVLRELIRRDLMESRIFPGERGRGGRIMRVRIAYENPPRAQAD